MTDVELLVRETLGRQEAEVPTMDLVEAVPVAARARRRQVMNALGAGIAAVIIALGVITGVGAILRAEGRRPAIEPPKPPAPPMALVNLPPAGVGPSAPTNSELVVRFAAEDLTWPATGDRQHWEGIVIDVYADGRLVWSQCGSMLPPAIEDGDFTGTDEGCRVGTSRKANRLSTGWLQQSLTTEAVEDLRAEVLATGLFEGGWESVTPNSTDLLDWMSVDVRVGDQMKNVRVDYQDIDFNPPTQQELVGLEHLQEIFLDLEAWFAEAAWADKRVVPFVPSSYSFWAKVGTERALLRDAISLDVAPLEPKDLPVPADRLLTRQDCDVVSLDEARAILEGFQAAGITRSKEMSSGDIIAFLVRGGDEGVAVYFEPNTPGSAPNC